MRAEASKNSAAEVSHRNSISGIFTVTTIQPTNIYKKIVTQCKDQILQRDNCHFLNSFYIVNKYKLFDCKAVQSILMSDHPLRQEAITRQVAMLKMHLHKLTNYELALKKKS